MRWQHKAKIMKVCASLPSRDKLYKFIQKNFGRLDANPMSRIPTQIEMAHWILNQDLSIEGKRFFEVGTGHIPIVPIGFFLTGATSVITVDLNTRLDYDLTQSALLWLTENRKAVESMYGDIVDRSLLNERLAIVEKLWSEPRAFLKEANIQYLAPADAAHTSLPDQSIDYHFSITTLEHIPGDVLKKIFVEARRILNDDGIAIHFIDLSDHFQHQDKSITKINFLRFSEKEWLRIAGNEFAYCNRMRASDYQSLLKNLSFDTLRYETEIDDNALNNLQIGFPLDEAFSSYKPDDICVTRLRVMLTRED